MGENRISSVESFGKETNGKITELKRKHSEGNEKLVNLSNIKTKFESFLRDQKTESENVNQEFSKVKKELSNLQEKQKDFSNEKDQKEANNLNQNFENNTKESFTKIEKKISGLEKSNKDTESKVMDLKKVNNSDKFASKDEIASINTKLDRKAEVTDIKSF